MCAGVCIQCLGQSVNTGKLADDVMSGTFGGEKIKGVVNKTKFLETGIERNDDRTESGNSENTG